MAATSRTVLLFLRSSWDTRACFAQRARDCAGKQAGAFSSTIEWMPRELVSATVLNSADAWRRARRTTQRTNLLLPCSRRRNGAVIISTRHRSSCKSHSRELTSCYLTERGSESAVSFSSRAFLRGKQKHACAWNISRQAIRKMMVWVCIWIIQCTPNELLLASSNPFVRIVA